jgi:hypothetical protein
MLFNLFGKKESESNNHAFIDRAYVSTAAKMKACANLAKKEPKHVFICWFTDTALQFKAFFVEQELDENLVIEARKLNISKLLDKVPVFTEHFPLHEKEIDFIRNWHIEKIIVYSALDEPLFKHFGSDKLIPLMKMLGMKEDEVIEHNMVTKSIIKGQEKIREQVTLEQPAASQDEWMRKNIH